MGVASNKAKAKAKLSRWRARRLWGSIAIFLVAELITLGVLSAWPKAYSAEALLILEPAPGVDAKALEQQTPEAIAAALEQALYNSRELVAVAKELGDCPEASESASSCLAAVAGVELKGKSSYRILFTSATAEKAQRGANTIAKHLAQKGPDLFAGRTTTKADAQQAKRELETVEKELSKFLREHPGVDSTAPTSASAKPAPAAPKKPEAKAEVSEANRKQWRNLLGEARKAEAKVRSTAQVLRPRVVSRVVRAQLPLNPIAPNRPLLGFVGTWLAAAAVGVWWTTVTSRHRQLKAAVRAAAVAKARGLITESQRRPERSGRDQSNSSIPPSSPDTARITALPLSNAPQSGVGQRLPPAWVGGVGADIVKNAATETQVVVMIAAPSQAERKSRAAARLALSLAEDHALEVLLLESEFERPLLQTLMGFEVPAGAGFSQQLNIRAQRNEQLEWRVVKYAERLHVLAEGRIRCPGLLLSYGFADSINELKQNYRVIVIDGPRSFSTVEQRALADVANTVVVVVDRAGAPNPVKTGPLGPKVLRTVTASP